MKGNLVLVGMLLMGSTVLSQESVAYAIEGSQIGSVEEDFNYYFIYYGGGEQEIVINENAKLILTGWTDESKSSLNGKLEIQKDSTIQIENITLEVNNELNELAISETESIKYRLALSDSFKVLEVKPLELNEQVSVVAENENGTSIEEIKTVDENGTVIQNEGKIYYSTNENNQKIVITEEEYNSLNSNVDSVGNVVSSNDSSIEKVENSSQITEEVTSVRTLSINPTPIISYSTHVQDYGWLGQVSNGVMSGTVGQAKRLEAIKISLENAPFAGSISYSTHVQGYGWLSDVSNGALSGTSGESKRLEAIKINLTGEMAEHFDVYYRVHAESYGWLDWAKNGESAGTQGLSKRLEAIEVVLVEKGGAAPGPINKPFIVDPSVVYSSHVQDYGWLADVSNGKTSGTVGQAKRMEAVKISLKNAPYPGGISYRTHVQDYGWLNNVSNGALSGTSGQSKRLEAIQLNLTGEMAERFDVYYRVHAESYGWLDWAKNGESAGTQGLSKRLEAFEVVLVAKGGAAPGPTNKPFVDVGLFINYNMYNITLTDAVNMQMKVAPQTDKYSAAPAYVSSQYINVFNGGSISGNGVNLRTSPTLNSSIDVNVGKGTLFKMLDDNVTGDIVSGSTRWYKIEYNGKVLYVHSTLATILRLGEVTADSLSVRSEKSTASHIYGTEKKEHY
ncbi:hypothetical protein [Bacillus sp. T3]|uniref:hypothetical protein n=1 Tax=Bacillus sp. T3 TaxID=467262 RepID=UPI00298190E7|nr:hypothetical protein [Bacillus sp. T3]